MIRVEHDWWKTLFDEVYLVTDAPFVCNPALTKREVESSRTFWAYNPQRAFLMCVAARGVMP